MPWIFNVRNIISYQNIDLIVKLKKVNPIETLIKKFGTQYTYDAKYIRKNVILSYCDSNLVL